MEGVSPVSHRSRNTWNDGEGGGGGEHTSITLSQEWIFTNCLAVWKHRSLL